MINMREAMGVTLLGEANREAPVRTEPHPELRPTCAASTCHLF
jgi:hypothetical protein